MIILAAELATRHILSKTIVKQRAKRCMKILNVGLLLGASIGALLFTGCATITRGTTEQLTIQSEPTGANVRLSTGFTGVTPVTFTVPRKGDIFVTVSKEGFESAELAIKSQLSGKGTAGFMGNVLIGGIIGGGVDVATGATLSHGPNPAKVTLVPKPMSPAAVTEKPITANESNKISPASQPATVQVAQKETNPTGDAQDTATPTATSGTASK